MEHMNNHLMVIIDTGIIVRRCKIVRMLMLIKSVQYSLSGLLAELFSNFVIESNVWRQDETWQEFARIRIHMVNGKKSGYPDKNLFGNSRLMAKAILPVLRFPPSLPAYVNYSLQIHTVRFSGTDIAHFACSSTYNHSRDVTRRI